MKKSWKVAVVESQLYQIVLNSVWSFDIPRYKKRRIIRSYVSVVKSIEYQLYLSIWKFILFYNTNAIYRLKNKILGLSNFGRTPIQLRYFADRWLPSLLLNLLGIGSNSSRPEGNHWRNVQRSSGEMMWNDFRRTDWELKSQLLNLFVRNWVTWY